MAWISGMIAGYPERLEAQAPPSSAAPTASVKTPRAPQADWIWVADVPLDQVPRGSAYFRKSIQFSLLEKAQLQIGANDAYELYINGRRVASDQLSEQIKTLDITSYVRPGNNVFAIRVENTRGSTAGLFARLYVKPRNEGWRGLGTSETWLASRTPASGWQLPEFDDRLWKNAKLLQEPSSVSVPMQTVATHVRLRDEAASDNGVKVASQLPATSNQGRFTAPQGFTVDELLDHEETGSLIAIAFNEFGHIVASREEGPLLLIYDANKDGIPEKVREYSDKVKNIQGILPLNGDVFVTGDGEHGNGLYRLMDQNRDGKLEQASLIVRFRGQPGEHGAHQLVLGPDGMLYIVLGNHVQVDGPVDSKSPYRAVYEGDLVQPREEDPGGHAQGIKAPGGTVIRVELSGERVQLVAGGLRNAYDLAFHPSGALFVHDSDMEADIGTSWHRTTSLFQVTEGGEYGWRSGWANQPEYYLDRLPALLSTGRSSPTGAIVYNHHVYPKEYHQNLFLADWSEGRILRVEARSIAEPSSFKAEAFLSGRPMNVTDLDIGPDGSLYFCTGGRSTSGGIYRVRWTGDVPASQSELGEGIAQAIRQPQMHSAWGRQAVALLKRELGDQWDSQVAGVAYSPDNPARYRIRALDLMQLLGPVPSVELLVDLSRAPNEALRGKTASMLALHPNDETAMKRLRELLSDNSLLVQQAAAEGLIRADQACSAEALIPLLISENRELAFVAGRLLQRQASDVRAEVLERAEAEKQLIRGTLASILADPSREQALSLLPRLTQTAANYMSDQDFIDLLRVMELVLHLGEIQAQDAPELAPWIVSEFPAGDPRINRQLIRLAVHLQATDIVEPALAYLRSNQTMSDRVDVGLHLRFLKYAWSSEKRSELLRFFEMAQAEQAGSSYGLYVMNATQDLAEQMEPDEAVVWALEAEKSPNAALAALRKLPPKLPTSLTEKLIEVDQRIDQGGFEADIYKRLKTGISAILARNADAVSIDYLRQVWRRSPDRRAVIALALAQDLSGDNWDYVVRSLHILDMAAIPEILTRLSQVGIATEDPEAVRQVILLGLKLDRTQQNPAAAIELLEHWTGINMRDGGVDLTAQLAGWQDWYRGKYPEQSDPILPEDQTAPKWSLAFLEQYLDGDSGSQGSWRAGMAVYQKAQCAACHRLQESGTALGPDLTSLAKRFNRQEALESILYPSHVISDQYATKKIMTQDGVVVTGVVQERNDSILVRTMDRQQLQIPRSEIEEIIPSKSSLMPNGLLDNLSPIEIRDLMCYLGYVPPLAELAEPRDGGNLRR
jgi:putative heme-binding domain-containing protein